MDTKVCVRCGTEFARSYEHTSQWRGRLYCSLGCYRSREPAPLAERFWRYVHKGEGCWEWTAALGGSGYGTFGLNRRRMMPAHRFSWELHFGPIPAGLWVLHHCDNRLCVRPDHLFMGTVLTNVRDMDRKGRRVPTGAPGESNANAKLTEAQVREIRRRYDAGERPTDLAPAFGVSAPLISYIGRRTAWRHVR